MKQFFTIQGFAAVCLIWLLSVGTANAQSSVTGPVFDFYELKGLLLKHKATAESILSMKRFRLVSGKARAESTIYAYSRESDATKILVRIRKNDGLVSEVAWNEPYVTLGNLTHDAVHDGFVPVSGNSQYHNRFQKMRLLVGYSFENKEIIPCIIRSVE